MLKTWKLSRKILNMNECILFTPLDTNLKYQCNKIIYRLIDFDWQPRYTYISTLWIRKGLLLKYMILKSYLIFLPFFYTNFKSSNTTVQLLLTIYNFQKEPLQWIYNWRNWMLIWLTTLFCTSYYFAYYAIVKESILKN